ncbi:transposase [Nonomuraea sp. NPDC005650]|uniref:transposase n=1 Tax=Nonomuraea sp. NPDC005650 TaxID=3157045 RepID=UPI00339EB603
MDWICLNAGDCASPGCRCRGRKPSYPSDLTDAEWAVMAELVAATGRPMVHDLRAVFDAVTYLARYGIERRALPVDFQRHEAVYAFFLRWSRRGLPERLAGRLRGRLRVMAGRGELPTALRHRSLHRLRIPPAGRPHGNAESAAVHHVLS